MTDYNQILASLKSLMRGVPYATTNLANASALLNEMIPGINWVGFYQLRDNRLVLGPFQGKVACTMIAIGRGVCSAAVTTNSTQLVSDVHSFPGHIACDGASRSEIVVPIRRKAAQKEIWGVLDVDSPLLGRFTEEDRKGLEGIAKAIGEMLETSV